MPKRILQGTVVSNKNEKTLVVNVVRRLMHPVLKKTVHKSKHYVAHNPVKEFAIGDMVSIIESRPLSKTKRWIVLEE